jgi:hypothetical protein
MLQQLSDAVRHCYRRAGESRRRAEIAPDLSTAETYYQLEESWLRLAESCQLSQRLSAFLQSNSISKYVVARPAAFEWRDMSTVPSDCEVEVGTLDDDIYRIFAFPVRRLTTIWVADGFPGPLDIAPTHWRQVTNRRW